MRARIVNAISLEMEKVSTLAIDMLAQNANCQCYTSLKQWFTDLVLMYGLTIALSNDTYIKTSLKTFQSFIVPQIENACNVQSIVDGLTNILSLLA